MTEGSPAQTAEGLVDRIRALAPFIAAYADQAERERKPVDAVMAALAGTGVFRSYVPRRFGGYEIDTDTFAVVKKVLFGSDADAWPSLPEIGAYEAGVLLELAKDMLYQAYVRKGKLQQAMMVRRFFAEETLDKITPIGRAAGAD